MTHDETMAKLEQRIRTLLARLEVAELRAKRAYRTGAIDIFFISAYGWGTAWSVVEAGRHLGWWSDALLWWVSW